METLVIQSDSKEKIKLLLELSRKLKVTHKKLNKSEMEDFVLAKLIDEGRKSGNVSKETVLKALRK
jgi:hypothetical protein